MSPRYLSEEQAAGYLGFSLSQVGKMRVAAKIRAIVISPRCIRYDMHDLDEFMDSLKRGGDGNPESAAVGAVPEGMRNKS